MLHVSNHKYYYVDYVKMGAYLKQLRLQQYGSNRSEFVRKLNQFGKYRWDQSAYRKVELGQIELSLDRLCEVVMMFCISPTEVLVHCTYC